MSDPDGGGHQRLRPTWLTFGLSASAAAVLISIVVYAVSVGHDIGAMRQQVALNGMRIDALEQKGSGPVQQSAERLAQVQARVDRILTELLSMQQHISELATQQARQGTLLEQQRRP